jgi:hypothetical protein
MTGDDKITLRRHSISQLETYDVTADELDGIERDCMDVGQDFQFASISLSVAVSFLIALILTRIESDRVYLSFFAIVTMGFVFTIYFGTLYSRKKRAFQSTIQRVRDRQVGPVGSEGQELPPSVLANLPLTQPEKITVNGIVEEATDNMAAPQEAAAATTPVEAAPGE